MKSKRVHIVQAIQHGTTINNGVTVWHHRRTGGVKIKRGLIKLLIKEIK